MHDVLICALSLATGLAIAEYYNRGRIDAIRREQLDDLRFTAQDRRGAELSGHATVAHAITPEVRARPRRTRDLISQEQFEEYQKTGATRGKRIAGENER